MSITPSIRIDQQARDLRFLESLQDTLAGCRDLAAVYSSAVHRIAANFECQAVCLAGYEPVGAAIEVLHQSGSDYTWDFQLLHRVIVDQHSVTSGAVLAVPVISSGGRQKYAAGSTEWRLWGVVAVACTGTWNPAERRTLRAAAERVARELDRRRSVLVDDVLDSLLRKTKPIDVYTHTLRELRRFIRYDHSASVMTMQPGTAQITVRVEKVVSTRSRTETLIDSTRRGRQLRLTAAQTRYLSRLETPVVLINDGSGYRLAGARLDPESAGLWRVLCLGESSGEGSILCFPLIFGGQMLGILRLAAARSSAFHPIHQYVQLLDRFARLLAVTLYRSELYHRSDRQLQAIKQIGRVITDPKSVEEICSQVLQLALRVLHVQVGGVGLLEEDGRIELIAHQGCTLASPPTLRAGAGIAGRVVLTGFSRAVPDVTKEPGYILFNARVRSELTAPITYNREVIGFLNVESFENGRFREEDEEVITFLEALANQAAIAIKAAQFRLDAMRRLGSAMPVDATITGAEFADFLVDELRGKIDQLAAANERLAIANRAKSEFLAGMSHDLRGPLNVIIGLANLLTDPSVASTLTPEKYGESLDIIRSSGEVLASLIGNILDLSALEAGKVQLTLGSLNIQSAFSYVRSMAKQLAEEFGHDLTVSLIVDPRIVTIDVDEEKFLRIIINLLSNAVKFTPSGGNVDVSANIDMVENDSQLHVIVSDTGVGIAPSQHESIFDPFQRVLGASSGQPHGSGLGLAVVRQLVELHSGAVWVESSPGEGSSFHVVLPDALSGRTEKSNTYPPDGSGSANREPGYSPADPTGVGMPTRGLILVVEDTEAHLNVMRLAVTSRGYAMHGARSGEEALEWLAGNRPDVILLDLQLPGIDGFTVAAHVRSQVETHSIPIIAVTADALSANEERALASGCDAYLTKPIVLRTLLATIDAVTTETNKL